MIKTNKNNRKYFIDIKAKQLNLLDERWYEWEGRHFPSVTSILEAYPKGSAFYNWLKKHGDESDKYRDFTAAAGSRIHDACHRLAMGDTVSYYDVVEGSGTVENFSFEEWEKVCAFANFWNESEFECLLAEQIIVNPSLEVAGTMDLAAKKGDDVWIIDIKTGNEYDHHSLQIAAYANAYNDMIRLEKWLDPEGKKIKLPMATKGAVLYLGAKYKRDWKLKEVKNIAGELEAFKALLAVWKHANPKAKPRFKTYPTELTLEKGVNGSNNT
jgi:hypothetical protein